MTPMMSMTGLCHTSKLKTEIYSNPSLLMVHLLKMEKSYIHLTMLHHLLQDFIDGKAKTMPIDGTLISLKASLKSSMKRCIVTRKLDNLISY